MPKLFIHAQHGPIWRFPAMLALAQHASAKLVTFAMCAFGAPWQKMTSLLYTSGFDSWLDVLKDRKCTHDGHAKAAGGDKNNGKWNSGETAAYPPDFNSYLAQAAADLVRRRLADTSPATTETDAPPDRSQGSDAMADEPSGSLPLTSALPHTSAPRQD